MYDIKLPTGEVIAHIAERQEGVILRNVLKTRRAFYATVLDTQGNTILKFTRPVKYLLNSSINVLDCLDTPLGSVHQTYHVWRRRYDLVNQKNDQFGLIDGESTLLTNEKVNSCLGISI
jgi:hypothetical protein